MSNQENSKTEAQVQSFVATTPVFVHDRDQDRNQNISWVVGDDHEGAVPEDLQDEGSSESTHQTENETHDTEEPYEDESTSSEAEDEEEVRRKRANKNTAQKRISELTRRAKEAEAFANRMAAEKLIVEQRLHEKEKEAFDNSEKHITSSKDQVQKYLQDAIEEGDPSKIARATDLLSQYNAKLLMMNEEKERIKNTPPPQQSQQQTYQSPPQNNLNDEMMQNGIEWIGNNSWADRNSEDFDEEMHDEADAYSTSLARQYKFQGKGGKIGTPEFYNDISEYIFEKFKLNDSPPSNPKPTSPAPRERMTMKSSTSAPVASVNRPATTTPQRSKKDIQLSPEQREMAWAMAGTIKDNNRNIITDKKSLEEHYKRHLMAQEGI